MYGERVFSNFIDLQRSSPAFPKPLAEDCLFPIVYSCLFCQRLTDHEYVTLFLGSVFCSIDPYVLFLCQCHAVLITVAL